MGQLLSGLIALIGAWLVGTSWTGWYSASPIPRYLDLVLGVVALILGIIQIVRTRPGRRRTRVFDWVTLASGVVLFVAGIAVPGQVGAIRASQIVCGLLLIVISWIAVHLPAATVTKMVSIEGQVLLEMSTMLTDKRGIGIKGKIMGAMPATIYVKPNELWNMLSMITPQVIFTAVKHILLPPRDIRSPKSK
jgi:hypothetical protein